MKLLGYIWGVGGVLILLLFAIYRLAPMALALEGASMEITHWACLAFSISYMAYAEGCLLYTSPSPRDYAASRMPSSA